MTSDNTVDDGLIWDLGWRGMIQQMTAEESFKEHLAEGMKTVYCGFDPTADSLHIGSLVPLLALKRFQQYGHKPIALVGGSTGLIGDPSFKASERQLNSEEVVGQWVDSLKKQVSQFVDFDCGENSAIVANNLDWTEGVDVLSFLRDVGKHFSINQMIQKESVKQRIDREGEGISFTEFTYMILQSYDFAELNKRYDCSIQIGGSDQWGNITGGIDLTRRMNRNQVFGLTLPLVTKSDGTKFGKTESGTIWLDAKKTSQYAFYQFWLNTADADVYKFLKYFTFLSEAEILAIEEKDKAAQGRPEAQGILAKEVTQIVHGDAGLESAKRITQAMFNGTLADLSQSDLEQLAQDGLPSSELSANFADKPLTALLSECGMVKVGREVKDALGRNAVLVNGVPKGTADNMKTSEIFASDNALYGRFFLVKLGKKKNHLFTLAK
ncbi:MAG: tyrosine--tRNA ligase [Kangiellaceae bacterium]